MKDKISEKTNGKSNGKSNGKTHGKNLVEMNARVAQSREEITALAAGLHEEPSNGGKHHDSWAGFRHRPDTVSARGGKLAQGLADKIERHPVIGGLVAFGVGFGIATLLFKRRKRDVV